MRNGVANACQNYRVKIAEIARLLLSILHLAKRVGKLWTNSQID